MATVINDAGFNGKTLTRIIIHSENRYTAGTIRMWVATAHTFDSNPIDGLTISNRTYSTNTITLQDDGRTDFEFFFNNLVLSSSSVLVFGLDLETWYFDWLGVVTGSYVGYMGVDAFNSPNYLPGVSGSFQPSCIIYGTGQTYLVTYDGGGSTGGSVPVDNNGYVLGASVTVKANTGSLVKSGYNFKGWATTSNASTPEFAVNGSNVNPPSFNMPANNVTLYAVWQQITPCNLTYNGNGHTTGSAPTDSNSPYTSGSTVTVKGNTGNLEKTDHTFLGWSTNSSAQTAQYTQGQTFTINTNTTLYAIWQPTGGGGFDGGTINNPLEIKCKFLSLPKVWTDVFNWMTDPATNPSDYSAFLRFTNINSPLNLSTDIYGITLKDTNNTPFAAIGINDSLLVRKNFFAQFGSIGELSVPSGLKVDSIENFANNKDLTLKATVGQKILLDGNVQVTGSLTGNGGGGILYDGGIIHHPIEIRRPFLPMEEGGIGVPTMRQWMYANPPNPPIDPIGDYPEYINALTPGIGVRFAAEKYDFIDMFGFKLPAGGKGVAVNYHLWVRKDFAARGFLKSYEGNIILHGNGPDAVKGNDQYNIGWGPRIGTPFIWLAEGGNGSPKIIGTKPNGDFIYEFPYPQGNPKGDTLIIGVMKEDPPEATGLSDYWDFGNVEAGDFIAHRNLLSAHLKSASATEDNTIGVHSHLVPYNLDQPSNAQTESFDLGSDSLPWENLYVKNLYVSGVGGGNNGNIKKGHVAANVNLNGTVTVSLNFPAGTNPIVNVTVIDTAGRPIIAVITAKSNNSFTVKTMMHKHLIGTVEAKEGNPLVNHVHGNPLNPTYGNPGNYLVSGAHTGPITSPVPSGLSAHSHNLTAFSEPETTGKPLTSNVPSHVRSLYMRDGSGSPVTVGGAMIQSSNPNDYNNESILYTANNAENIGGTQMVGTIAALIGGVEFDWIAVI